MEIKTANKLIDEKSPYLLQHAYNPVQWYPWGEEAFLRAKQEQKPIFLSIGYSTCHWCHVMEQESFEDEEVAKILNENFIPIKVDREERPDIDAVYMTVCQAFTGQGGWPLTILLTPEQTPFFAGTYFPKHSRYQMPGLVELLEAIKMQWQEDKSQFEQAGREAIQLIRKGAEESKKAPPTKNLCVRAVKFLKREGDSQFGGFGGAPKFPSPHHLIFLMRYFYYEQDKEALKLVNKTLEGMYQGGIFDHIGFGFSRYSTDPKWLVPHFEKMLYDNALLCYTYLEAYQVTGKKKYQEVAKQVLDYVAEEMTSPEGGFYSAQDADSDGEEGKYYLFTPEEIRKVLGSTDGEYFNRYYGITEEGNFEGKNIPNRIGSACKEDQQRIPVLREKVYQYRAKRTSLGKDDKILTSWNAMMIVSYAKAYQVLGNPKDREAAEKAMDFLMRKLSDGKGNLLIRYRDGEAKQLGCLDDYAYVIWALLELYQMEYKIDYLKKALFFQEKMTEKFWDREKGGFFLTASDGEKLVFRPKETYDGAIPSGNSVAAYVLEKLSKLTGNEAIRKQADKQIKFLCAAAQDYPQGNTFFLTALLPEVYPTRELICCCEDIGPLNDFLRANYLPDLTVVVKRKKDHTEQVIPLIQNYPDGDKQESYFLCENHRCRKPVHTIRELEKSI